MNAKGDEYEYLPGGFKKWKADRNCVTGWNGKSFQDERKNILHTQALYFLPRTKIYFIEVCFSLEIVFVYLRRDRWGEAVWITNWGEACRGRGGKRNYTTIKAKQELEEEMKQYIESNCQEVEQTNLQGLICVSFCCQGIIHWNCQEQKQHRRQYPSSPKNIWITVSIKLMSPSLTGSCIYLITSKSFSV